MLYMCDYLEMNQITNFPAQQQHQQQQQQSFYDNFTTQYATRSNPILPVIVQDPSPQIMDQNTNSVPESVIEQLSREIMNLRELNNSLVMQQSEMRHQIEELSGKVELLFSQYGHMDHFDMKGEKLENLIDEFEKNSSGFVEESSCETSNSTDTRSPVIAIKSYLEKLNSLSVGSSGSTSTSAGAQYYSNYDWNQDSSGYSFVNSSVDSQPGQQTQPQSGHTQQSSVSSSAAAAAAQPTESSPMMSYSGRIPPFHMDRNVSTISDLLREWFQPNPDKYNHCVSTMEAQYKTRWRSKAGDKKFFLSRKRIVQWIIKEIKHGKQLEVIIEEMERSRYNKETGSKISLDKLSKVIKERGELF